MVSAIGDGRRSTRSVILHDNFEGPSAGLAGRKAPIGGQVWFNQFGGNFQLDGSGNVQVNPAAAGDNDIRIDAGVPLLGVTIEAQCANAISSAGLLINCLNFNNLVQILPASNGFTSVFVQNAGSWSNIASTATPVDILKPFTLEISADGDTFTLRDYLGVIKLQYSTPNRPLKNYTQLGIHTNGTDARAAFQYITLRRT